MKKAIQLLSFSLFVSFTFPCFQMCSDATLLKRKHQETPTLASASSPKTAPIKPAPLGEEKTPEEQAAKVTFSTYELALKSFELDTVADLKERESYPLLCFTGVLLCTVLLCYYAVRERFLGVFRISLVTISLLITAVGLWVYDNTLEEFQQLKWGFYVVLVTLLVLAIFSNLAWREKKKEERSKKKDELREVR